MIFKPIKNYTYYDTVEEELFAGASDFLSKLPFVPDFSIWKRTYLGYEPTAPSIPTRRCRAFWKKIWRDRRPRC